MHASSAHARTHSPCTAMHARASDALSRRSGGSGIRARAYGWLSSTRASARATRTCATSRSGPTGPMRRPWRTPWGMAPSSQAATQAATHALEAATPCVRGCNYVLEAAALHAERLRGRGRACTHSPPPWSQASSAAAPSALASLRTPSCISSRSSTRSRRRQMHMPMPRHNHRHSVRYVPPAAGLVHLVVPRRVQLRALPTRARAQPVGGRPRLR